MASSQIFYGITPDVLRRLDEGDVEDIDFNVNPDGKTGTISGKTAVGYVEVAFEYVEERAQVTLTVLKKPMLLPAPLLWAEFSRNLREAGVDPNIDVAATGDGS